MNIPAIIAIIKSMDEKLLIEYNIQRENDELNFTTTVDGYEVKITIEREFIDIDVEEED